MLRGAVISKKDMGGNDILFQVEDLYRIVGKENVLCDEPLSKHTTFRIGGAASYFVSPAYIEDFIEAVAYVREKQMPYFVLGNGSNLLAYDKGYDGVILATHMSNRTVGQQNGKTALDAYQEFLPGTTKRQGFFCSAKAAGEGFTEKDLQEIDRDLQEKTVVFAGSGIMLSTMAYAIAKKGLTGFEFAGGIPGTLGGAVTMNAGAYGGEIKDCILGAGVLYPDGTVKFLSRDALSLGYRTSTVQKEKLIVLWALFAFQSADAAETMQTLQELNQRRREKQPLQYASAGSTFKRPEGHFAGKLIEEAGLRGFRAGDVMVSEKHCGFVVNVGEGTYDDARQVIEHVQKTVQEKFGVRLEMEVKMIE
jgi:UDP-N-acetylmuramate dehydrogenase